MISPEEVVVVVSSETNALLTVAMVNYPGWEATINGEETPIVDNYAGLMGIPLQAGTEMVIRLTYQSQALMLGMIFSLISLALLFGCGVIALMTPHPRTSAITD
jgi:uncharacterized membrane protein YfhO